MARNIATGKSVQGLEDLQKNVAKLIDRMDGEDLQNGLGDIAKWGARMLEDEAEGQGWPHEAVESIFVYSKLDPKESRRKKGPSTLFGFRKRGRSQPYAPGYVEWFPARSRSKRAKSLVLPGTKAASGSGMQKIGMSLATMYEFGTSKLKARPALRPIITRLRAMYAGEVGKVLQRILAKHTPR